MTTRPIVREYARRCASRHKGPRMPIGPYRRLRIQRHSGSGVAAAGALASADGEDGGDRPVTHLGHVLDLQPGTDERGEQLGERVMPHAEPAPDVRPPPRRLGMPARPAVGRLHDLAAPPPRDAQLIAWPEGLM